MDLFKQILLEVSYDLLKQQFVDTEKVTQQVFDDIKDASNNKSAYATWLLKKVSEKMIKPEDVYKFKEYLDIYDKNRLKYQFKDINLYKTKEQVADLIRKSVELKSTIEKDPSQAKGVEKKDKYKQFELGTVDGFTVYEIPKGRTDLYGMSCDLGSGTEWCTATGKTKDYFNRYINAGPLYIFIKPSSNEKYQFSFAENQFMDKDDRKIEIKSHLNLFRFLLERGVQIGLFPKLLLKYNNFTEDDLNVSRGLYLPRDVVNLPDGLRIGGDLDLNTTNIKKLPNNLYVRFNLWIEDSNIEYLPESLNVGGNIYAANSNLKKISKKLRLGNSLNIDNTEIQQLPDNLLVSGDLSMRNCAKLLILPVGLDVGGNLDLHNSSVKVLPSDLKVGKDLDLYKTNVDILPKSIEVRGKIFLNRALQKKYNTNKFEITQADIKATR